MNLIVESPYFLTQAPRAKLKAAVSAKQPAKVINIASVDRLKLNLLET